MVLVELTDDRAQFLRSSDMCTALRLWGMMRDQTTWQCSLPAFVW